MRKSNLTKKVSIESSFSANDLAILFQVSLLTLIIEGFFSLNAALSPLREAQESIRSPRSSTGSQRSHASECSNSSRLDSSSDSRNSAKDLNSNSPYPRPPLIENEKIASHLGNFGISPNQFLFWLPGTCKSQPNPKPAGMNTIWKCREDRFLTRFPDPRRMAMLWSVCPSRSPMTSWDIPVPIIFMSWKSWIRTVPCEREVKNQCRKQGPEVQVVFPPLLVIIIIYHDHIQIMISIISPPLLSSKFHPHLQILTVNLMFIFIFIWRVSVSFHVHRLSSFFISILHCHWNPPCRDHHYHHDHHQRDFDFVLILAALPAPTTDWLCDCLWWTSGNLRRRF